MPERYQKKHRCSYPCQPREIMLFFFLLCQNLRVRVTVFWFDAVSVELRIQIKCLYCGEDACAHILSSLLVSLCHYGSTPTPASSTRPCQKNKPMKKHANMQISCTQIHCGYSEEMQIRRNDAHVLRTCLTRVRTIQRFSYILEHPVLLGAGD